MDTKRIQELVDAIRELDEDNRLEVLGNFCPWCGDYTGDDICYCMHDE